MALSVLAAVLAATGAGRAGAGDEKPMAGRLAGGTTPGAAVEEVVTSDGTTYRGRVVGYDRERKSYIVESEGRELRLPESAIVTIRVSAAGEPALRTAPAGALAEARARTLRDLRSSRRRDDAAAVWALLEGSVILPEPADPAARRLYLEGLALVRDGDFARARDGFEAVLRAAPEALAPALFVGAIQIAQGDPRGAFQTLHSAWKRFPDEPVVLDLYAYAARAMGYMDRAGELAEQSIRRRFRGSERQYRLFLHRREHSGDPAETLAAWRDYLALDPELAGVSSLEGRLFRRGIDALKAADPSAALESFAAAREANPLAREVIRPFRVRALEMRALAARERGAFEIALADLDALERAEPQRAAELEVRRRNLAGELIHSRLASALTVEGARHALRDLDAWVPDLARRYRAEVGARMRELGRRAIVEGDIDEALHALTFLRSADATRAWDKDLLAAVRDGVKLLRARGRHETAGTWLAALERIAADVVATWRTEDGAAAPALAAETGAPGQDDETDRSSVGRAAEEDLAAQDASEGAAQPAPPPPAEKAAAAVPFFPLPPGAVWVYRHADGTVDVQRLAAVESHPVYGEVRRFESYFELDGLRIPYPRSCFRQGRYILVGAAADRQVADRILRLPIELQATWSWGQGDLQFERTYVALDAEVRCAAGVFADCLKVRSSTRYRDGGPPENVQWLYFARGVGLVKVESQRPGEGFELQSFTPAPPATDAPVPAAE